jgi:hypothetical protein
MENQNDIQKFEKKYMIIFTDRSEKVISEHERNMVLKCIHDNSDGVVLGGDYYRFFMLGKIIELGEYYNQYPNKRPAPTYGELPKEMYESIEKKAFNSKGATTGLIKGLKSFINHNENTSQKTLDLLARMELKLKQLTNKKDVCTTKHS